MKLLLLRENERVNADIDDDGQQLLELDAGEEVIYADSLCQPKNMVECLNYYWLFMLGTKKVTHFHSRMTKKN